MRLQIFFQLLFTYANPFFTTYIFNILKNPLSSLTYYAETNFKHYGCRYSQSCHACYVKSGYTSRLPEPYFQIRVAPEDETLNSIKTLCGTCACKIMLQGDTNGTTTAMQVMEYVLDRLIGKTVLAYLDDITIFSVTLENPVGDIHQVFQRVWDNNMRACPSKCNFLADRLPRLEHVIDDKGIQADLEKIRGIPDWHTRNRKMNYKLLLVL